MLFFNVQWFYKRMCELAGGFVVSSEKYFVVEIDEETHFFW